jgi:hypothetical protein
VNGYRAGDRGNDPSGDPPGEYEFEFLSGATTTETTIVDGKPVVKITTIVACGPSGKDCKQNENGNFVPKGPK